ncbi:hypothetical protein B0H19DRAFT_1081609 [Mycena capillaripes]|nr:hypothetical protein B0H19DRAFT_1081609 [Mycena capillaripes]
MPVPASAPSAVNSPSASRGYAMLGSGPVLPRLLITCGVGNESPVRSRRVGRWRTAGAGASGPSCPARGEAAEHSRNAGSRVRQRTGAYVPTRPSRVFPSAQTVGGRGAGFRSGAGAGVDFKNACARTRSAKDGVRGCGCECCDRPGVKRRSEGGEGSHPRTLLVRVSVRVSVWELELELYRLEVAVHKCRRGQGRRRVGKKWSSGGKGRMRFAGSWAMRARYVWEGDGWSEDEGGEDVQLEQEEEEAEGGRGRRRRTHN